MSAGTVEAIHRYPVKSMLGETLSAMGLGEHGLNGDRAVAVLDATGAVGSAKHPRKWGPLLACRSELLHGGTVRVHLPDGTALAVGDPELDAALSKLLGREVTLAQAPDPQGHRLERAVPDYPGGIPERLRETARPDDSGALVTSGGVAPGTFFDFGRVHLVTTSTLARLRAAHPSGDADARRFRPNLVIATPDEPGFAEDAWIGARLRIGTAVVRVTVPTPRCVVPALAHGSLPPDPALMRAVAREHRVPVLSLGRLSCVGVYLDVVRPGLVRVGDPVVREENE
ncbi:uncharacterized protein YcbX [Streptomyces sp. SAI-170]|uniref:MOSC domain-containing protein n=1 Tax=Streptomyces sp. SAI-170 TaxID=3377729 RepID=UPI003C7AD21A